MEVDDAAAKAALVQQLELGMDAGGQGALATAHEDRHEDEMALVDQPLGDRLAGELRTANRDVGSRALLQPRDRCGTRSAVLALPTEEPAVLVSEAVRSIVDELP